MLNATWALDFMADALYDGRRIRCLDVLDQAIGRASRSPWGRRSRRRVMRVLSDLGAVHGRPTAVRVLGMEPPKHPLRFSCDLPGFSGEERPLMWTNACARSYHVTWQSRGSPSTSSISDRLRMGRPRSP
jgi:hypothetical protein